MDTKRKVIIDCDPGVDDVMALAYALSHPDLDILAIHTVAGNVSCEHTTRNACGLLGMLGRHTIPVCPGSEVPLVMEPVFAENVHGKNGLRGYEFTEGRHVPVSHKTALQSYLDILDSAETKITIIALGPLTNLGVLLRAYPHLKKKIACISIMGGGIKGGNTTIAGEFNFYVDPHAAHIVLTSGIPIYLAGLDVTEKAHMHEEDYVEIERKHPDFGAMMRTISQESFAIAQRLGYGRTTAPHDVVAVAYLLHPEMFTTVDMELHVSFSEGDTRGMTYADQRYDKDDHKPNCRVIMEVDPDRFRYHVKQGLLSL